MITEPLITQPLIPTWFRAQDGVLRDHTPFTHQKQHKNPKSLIWKTFSPTDSFLLDEAFNNRFSDKASTLVAVGEDALYEADILKYEISPSNY
jgi:hypothetical protein